MPGTKGLTAPRSTNSTPYVRSYTKAEEAEEAEEPEVGVALSGGSEEVSFVPLALP